MSTPKPLVICICGSTRFKDQIMLVNAALTVHGWIVLAPGVFGHTDMPDYDWSTDVSDLKRRLDRLHFAKIDMADAVFIVNVDGYIGESTRRELDYALAQDKRVYYLKAPDEHQ
jgi:dienelactone hydrolase